MNKSAPQPQPTPAAPALPGSSSPASCFSLAPAAVAFVLPQLAEPRNFSSGRLASPRGGPPSLSAELHVPDLIFQLPRP